MKKCLMVQQPYASMIAYGEKTVEIRSYRWGYKGELVIAASANDGTGAGKEAVEGVLFPRGVTVGLVKMVDCVPFKAELHGEAAGLDPEDAQDTEESGQFAWVLEHVGEVIPAPIKGQVKPFDYPTDVELVDPDNGEGLDHMDYYNHMVNPDYVRPEDDGDDGDEEDGQIITLEIEAEIDEVRGDESLADWLRRAIRETIDKDRERLAAT